MIESNFQTSFDTVVNIFLRQDGWDVAPLIHNAHNHLFLAANAESNLETLAQGIYRLRYYLSESGTLHQWISQLNRTCLKTESPLTAIQREISFGWMLWLNNQPELAANAYNTAAALHKQLSQDPFGQVAKPQMHQLELDIMLGQNFMRINHTPTQEDVEKVVYRQRMWRQGSIDQEKRLILALAGMKLDAGMHQSSFANADEAHHFFSVRSMNAEAGLAAFYLARYYANEDNIDPIHTPATGTTLYWLRRAAKYWFAISLPMSERLLEPYIRHLNFPRPPRQTSRIIRDMIPPAPILN